MIILAADTKLIVAPNDTTLFVIIIVWSFIIEQKYESNNCTARSLVSCDNLNVSQAYHISMSISISINISIILNCIVPHIAKGLLAL